jgi:hypothetical protein
VPTQPWPHANLTRPDPPWRSAWRGLKRALGLEQGDARDADADAD